MAKKLGIEVTRYVKQSVNVAVDAADVENLTDEQKKLFKQIQQLCIEFTVNYIELGDTGESDMQHSIFETAMMLTLGDDIFKTINEERKKGRRR